ncbi:MAG: O-antigen ligase domain-containing protein [Rhizobium sp.]|nr:MAG: O-antigen ligase domain-containing protein [Rhizobium sp.]
MTVSASGGIGAAPSLWRNTAAWTRAADIAVVLVAISLPWSTSFVAIFAVAWLVLLIPTAERRDLTNFLNRPACWVPVLFFALAAFGMFWAADIPWATRFHSLGQVAKLLAIPVLILHFEKSGRGLWVMIGFIASCAVVMLLSWAIFVDPRVFAGSGVAGVPVKNTIAQAQEFTLCAFGALGAAMYALSRGMKRTASILGIMAIGFVANMVFVSNSRTALVCIPILFVLFVGMFFSGRIALSLVAAAIVVSVLAWNMSPYLRLRVEGALSEYQAYRATNAPTSTGQRLEYWRKSLKFFESAPVLGHGTGSTRALFERDAVGQTGVSAEVIANPHNQTLNVAIQWGALGVVLLYLMWVVHLRMFIGREGLFAWIGLVAVALNFFSSLLNSHLFDFTEGWIYVLAVGVAGGVVSKASRGRDTVMQAHVSPVRQV